MSDDAPERSWELTLIEKLVGTVVIGLLGWMAWTLQSVTVDVAVIKSELASSNRDRFTEQEGRGLSERIQRIEERVKDLETGAHQ